MDKLVHQQRSEGEAMLSAGTFMLVKDQSQDEQTAAREAESKFVMEVTKIAAVFLTIIVTSQMIVLFKFCKHSRC